MIVSLFVCVIIRHSIDSCYSWTCEVLSKTGTSGYKVIDLSTCITCSEMMTVTPQLVISDILDILDVSTYHKCVCWIFVYALCISAILQPSSVPRMDESGFQAGPTFPIFPAFPYFFIRSYFSLLFHENALLSPQYPFFFTLKCHLHVKSQKIFLARFSRWDFIC